LPVRAAATYKASEISIPPLHPGQTLTVPVFLTPADDPSGWNALLPTAADLPRLDIGWPPPPNAPSRDSYARKYQVAVEARAAWEQKYLNATTIFDVTTENPVGSTTFSQVTLTIQRGALSQSP
jgi:hypothetical protein